MRRISIAIFIKRYWSAILIGCSGWVITGIYLAEEYMETGSFSDLIVHLRTEMPLHHFVMISLIPLMMILAFLFTKQINLKEQLRILSVTDELTGLYNRRGFFTVAEQQLKMAQRLNRETLLISVDVDELKKINDILGHKEGDSALISTANILRQTFRQSDVIARIGGDEFVILQMEQNDTDSDKVTARLEKNIEIHNKKRNLDNKLSISIGTISFEPKDKYSIEELLVKADKSMYKHKMNKHKSSTGSFLCS